MKRLTPVLSLCALAGCGDPLVPPQTIVDLRVLGAKVSATDEPESSHVAPGKSAEVHWLIVAEETRTFHGLALWCRVEPSSIGTPPCTDPFLTTDFDGNTDVPVTLSFTLPDDFDEDAGWVHWLGLCESTTPTWNAATQRFGCDRGQVVSAVYRGNTSRSNHNPDLGDDALSLDREAWPAATTQPSCGDDGVPTLNATATATIRLEVGGNDREELKDGNYAAPTREALAITHVSTWPGLDRPYSSLDGDASSLELTFTSETAPHAKGDLVRFLLVARDGRGGTDWLDRWFCLKP